jgi:hypothetical protein
MSHHRKPDYRLKFLRKDTDYRGELGAAWKNPDGSIRIVLNTCVYLRQNEREVLTLFPADSEHGKSERL